ncbi:MAG: pilus (MSHA type) biogenesis protein MshL [Candidatus Accumulibacter sp. 66-26]|nr:pilus (MSHA type) biogenesis protein MshL [Accumulibacter sp.]OJW51639.1 MAG: pilus (MSHA type) biogenesis protein MshL [Candidatus Accumulibacter sp. 66-26]
MSLRTLGSTLAALLLAACASPTIKEPSSGHLRADSVPSPRGEIPQPVQQTTALPRPQAAARTETYSVVVNNVKVHDLLFALARDAKLNVDIHPGIAGNVTLNAIDQTLPQLLNRIAKQVDMRFELDGPNLVVMPDTPYLRNYRIDYVNMSRDTTGSVAVTTQIASAGGSGTTGGTTPSTGASGANNSLTRIENKSQNHFWETLVQNVKDILRETDKILPEGSSETVVEQASAQSTTGTGAPPAAGTRNAQAATSLAASPNPATLQNAGTTVVRRTTFREAASVIAHPESGVLTIRATSRQHEKIQEFLDTVLNSAKRQVLIEATIAEVELSNNYQQGIDWQVAPFGAAGFKVVQGVLSTGVNSIAAPASSLLQLGYTNAQKNMSATVKLLESFGNVKVLSSPKISVLNNQTAVLKVVDNNVYFTIKADTTQNQTTTVTTFTTTLNQVPVGFVMNVTPQISDTDNVLLNIRPSISRIVSYVNDPNPALKATTANGFGSDIVSQIPVIRSREMESVIRVENGNIAVMGGLMEDTLTNIDNAVPGISRIPGLGQLFTQRDDRVKKTELVIFLRPIVVREASVEGDYSAFRSALPGKDFFTDVPDPQRRSGEFGTGARR